VVPCRWGPCQADGLRPARPSSGLIVS
jgi:hypothetical protein